MIVNGKEKKQETPISLTEFLTREGYDGQRVAVEKNGEIIPRAKHPDIQLSDIDTLEIVHFVGGG
ncbi:MAG: sulfur carrier protein ThiS [Firmicutes bacterium]|nr:sulfur carrier protein ThiS [Bacillota bacterium]NBI62707.1 sulfur carrier protein ThiS [Clostridiales bacterium]